MMKRYKIDANGYTIHYTLYNRNNVMKNIGIRRNIYDMLMKSDLDITIVWIDKVSNPGIKADPDLRIAMTSFMMLEDKGVTLDPSKTLYMCSPGTLIPVFNMNDLKEEIVQEANILKECGYVKVFLKYGVIDGSVSDTMLYYSKEAEAILDKLSYVTIRKSE